MKKVLQATSYTFRDIIKGNFLYIDKTQYLYDLVQESKGTYFFSRPRRFGKSLTVSTLQEIFLGSKELFDGLWIGESDYDWQPYPVIRIDFGLHTVQNAQQLIQVLETFSYRIAKEYDLILNGFDYQSLFADLTRQLAETHNGKVVLLIDEYDKPIVDNITDLEEAIAIRDVLRAFYGVVKALEEHWRFVFITGISRFSKVGVFSTMNNLHDLTMSPRVANMLGITDTELRHYFKEHIEAFAAYENLTPDALLDKIRYWYDGFRFSHEGENLYNPYSTVLLFMDKFFTNYWFSSGTPTFLIKLLQAEDYDIQSLDRVEVDDIIFQTYELDNLAIIPLLTQTGYLTIKDFIRDELGTIFVLSYPNYEVKSAFITYLLNAYNGGDISFTPSHLRRLIRSIQAGDLEQFFETLNIFFANVDYALHIKDEKYYQTIFYMIFLLVGLRIDAEVKTYHGRIDAVIELQNHIYIFEFKLNFDAKIALKQAKNKGYADKYQGQGKPITLVGANFDHTIGKVDDWDEKAV